jgi:hypothetical protein
MRKTIVALCLLLAVSCKNEPEAPPIPQDKMQHILTDIVYAETYASMVDDTTRQIRQKNMDSLAVYYKAIFAHHKITSEQFSQALEWYRYNPGELDTVYKSMVNNIALTEGLEKAK